MIKINYPDFQPKIKLIEEREFIFDGIRKQWVLLTPEEWVRQNFVQYLILVLNYPASLISVEKEFYLGEVKKRFDLVVYDKNAKPWMVIECKEMNVALNEGVLAQVLRYNIHLQAPFVFITNGTSCYGFEYKHSQFKEMNSMPVFES